MQITAFTHDRKIWNLIIHIHRFIAEEVIVSDQGIKTRLVPQDEVTQIIYYINRVISN